MVCTALIPSVDPISPKMLIAMRVINTAIALFSIFGNAFLIYALKKTRQTTTVSLQLILLMSFSDLITGITAISLINALLWKELDSICQIKIATAFIHIVFGGFSFGAVFLIALDRFLHMKYLQRYPIIVTKRRAHLVIVTIFCFFLLSAALFSLPVLHSEIRKIELGFFMAGIPIIITTFVLYNRAIATAKRKVSSSHSAFTQIAHVQSRKIFKAAKLITASFSILLMPMMVSHVFLAINEDENILNAKNLTTFKWLSYIISLANGFCSCVIFILQNRPVRVVLNNIYEKHIRGEGNNRK